MVWKPSRLRTPLKSPLLKAIVVSVLCLLVPTIRSKEADPNRSSYKTRSKKEIEAEFLEVELAERRFGLTERRFGLFRLGILLGMTVVLTLVTVYCSVRGFHWPIPTATGTSGFVAAITSIIEGRRAKAEPGS